MTQDEWPHTWKARLVEAGKIGGAITSIGAAVALLWMFSVGPIRQALDFFTGIAEDQAVFQARTTREFERIWQEIENLADGVAQATGEDRIIREQPGQTYVREPVRQGQAVQFNFVASRTALGSACTLFRTVPMFVDESRIPQPGPSVFPRRQIGSQAEFLQPRYHMPETLQPGRVAMYLILEYDCPSSEAGVTQRVLDRTSTAVFRLLSGAPDTEDPQ
jgi:hypothetical protein